MNDDGLKDLRIVFFDGYCSLCNSSINICLNNNTRNLLKVASLQSTTAQKLLRTEHIGESEPDSIVFYNAGSISTESEAVLKIAGYMDFPYPLLQVFWIIPRPIRDWAYKTVARNRYRWFGKRETCRMPTEKERDMMLD